MKKTAVLEVCVFTHETFLDECDDDCLFLHANTDTNFMCLVFEDNIIVEKINGCNYYKRCAKCLETFK